MSILSAGAPTHSAAVKHRPADVVPQPLVVEDKLTNRRRELVTLPLALKSPYGLALAFRRGSTCGPDRIGGRTELVRGDVCNGPGLASSVRGVPCCPTQVSGRAHCVAPAARGCIILTSPRTQARGMLDRLTRSWVLRLSQLEEVKDVLGTVNIPWSAIDPAETLLRADDAMPVRRGSTKEVAPLDLSKDPELASLVEQLRTQLQ